MLVMPKVFCSGRGMRAAHSVAPTTHIIMLAIFFQAAVNIKLALNH